MKNFIKMFGIIVFITIMGLIVMSCPEPGNDFKGLTKDTTSVQTYRYQTVPYYGPNAARSAGANAELHNLVFSGYDDNRNYYVFLLGHVNFVPVAYRTAVYYNGTTAITIGYSITDTTETSITESMTTASENSTYQREEFNWNVSASAGFKGWGFSAKVSSNVGGKNIQETTSKHSTSSTFETALAKVSSNTDSISATIGNNNESAGHYRYTLFSTTDVYYVLITNRANPTQVMEAYTSICARPDYYWAIDYSPSVNFNKTADGNLLEIPKITLTNLPNPTIEFDITYIEPKPDFINMVQIPGGTFTMGSPASESGRNSYRSNSIISFPATYSSNENYRTANNGKVTLTGFYMSIYPITQDQYYEVMKRNPSGHTSRGTGKHPVENMSWYDALEFCNELSFIEGLTPVYTMGSIKRKGLNISSATVSANWNANGYRLPTEAEWEYACRAGTTTAFHTGNTINNNTGWYSANSGSTTHTVGQKEPNAWGLYDMHGNVWEWVWDIYTRSYDNAGGSVNPIGPSSGSTRVIRGGGWNSGASECRSARRWTGDTDAANGETPDHFGTNHGFRVVRPL
ncbi:MAG: formylglycine-generating enzyme family protein [Treponema sp.]|nr:formylglycine-generating enzyme family protein [Treponema sp.]